MLQEHPISTEQIADLELQRFHLSMEAQSICGEYGLYGNVILYRPSPIQGSRRNKLYLIASRDPNIMSGGLNADPEYYLRRNTRSDRLVYTDVFVYELSSDKNRLDAMEKLIEYCKYAEFLTNLYSRYNLPPPDKLRRFEIRQLMDARDIQRKETGIPWQQATNALNDFFSKERRTGLRKEWLDFFRSDKFPDDAGPWEKLRAFRRRHRPEVSLDQLMACNSCIHMLEMQEHEYRRFADFMQGLYPDVPYSVSEKIIIDNGTQTLSKDIEGNFGKRVTGEEYNRVLERTFAKDGGTELCKLQPTYFEIRKVSYAASDEPYIASAFNDATLRYARRDELWRIRKRGGNLQMYSIPKDDFMSFVSLAKANGLPFYIDNLGQFETPSLEFATVLCSSRDELIAEDILTRIVDEKIAESHLVFEEDHPILQEVITHANALQTSETSRATPQQQRERT